jgi:hypothetical protein
MQQSESESRKTSNDKHSTHHDTSEKDPGLVVGYVGSADIPAIRPGHYTGETGDYNPPLPGMEEYCPQGKPYEFNKSSQSLTRRTIDPYPSPSVRDLNSLTYEQRSAVLQWEEDEGLGVGACLNVFPSGEITGGCYSRGNKRAPGHKGKVTSTEFTKQAKKKIRRAVDCRITSFKLFITLTFDPKLSQLNESSSVDQEWAKDRFKQFLNTLKKKYDRMADKTGKDSWRISYIWVAEIQEMNTKNIHFHILVDRQFIDVKWLVKVWGQASNSVNVKRLNNQDHAVNYMLKYMKKGNCPIMGKRYGMTQNLTNGSKPAKYDFYGRSKRNAFQRIKEEFERQIKDNGGYVADWGLSIPVPCRPVSYRGKDGRTYHKPGTSQKIGQDFLERIGSAMSESSEPVMYDQEQASFVDLPF